VKAARRKAGAAFSIDTRPGAKRTLRAALITSFFPELLSVGKASLSIQIPGWPGFGMERTMKAQYLLAGIVLAAFTGNAMADEYYIATNPSTHRCTITTSKPADREYVTQIGPLAFKSREEAETRMKTVKTCEEGGTVGGASSTTVIKEK
jgi:hypothetical protein